MDRIKFRQFIIIVFLLAVAAKMFMLPTYMMRVSGPDSLIVMLIESAVDMLLLFVVICIIRSGKGSFVETVQYAFGKVLSKIMTAVLAVYYLCKLFLMLTEFKIFFSTAVLYMPLSPMHIVPLLLLLIFVSGKKLSVLGRVGEIIAPLVIISMFIMGAVSIPSIDFTNLLPLVTDPANIKEGLMSFPMWFGDFTLLLLFTGKTDARRRTWFSLIAAAAGLAVMILFASMMFALYKNVPEALTYGYNISNLTQYGVASFKFGRFDLLIFCIWLLGVLLSASVIVTFINRCINFTLGRDIGLYTAIVSCTLIVIAMYLFDNANEVGEVMTEFFALPAMIIQYGFPVLLLIALIIRRLTSRRLKRKGDGDEKAYA